MEVEYPDHKVILQQEEYKVIFFSIIIGCSMILFAVIAQVFKPQWIINILVIIGGVYLAHKKHNLIYFKWILSVVPALLPYQICNSFDGRMILFGMMHSVLNPIFCIFLSRSLIQTLILIMINAIGNFYYLQPKLFLYLNIEDNESKKFSIRIAFGLSFIAIIVFTFGLWYLFESRKNILEKLCKGRKEIHQMNEQLTLANKLLSANLKSKQDLLLYVSHEIRNSLNIISGSCEQTMMDDIKPKAKILLTKILSSVEIITYFLNNLLDGAKMEKYGLEVIPKPTKTWEFMEKLWNTAYVLIERKNLKGQIFIDKKIPLELNFDSIRVTQIIYNLVGNACKFTPNGYVGIVVTWIPKEISSIQIHEENDSYETYFRQAMMNDNVILDKNHMMIPSQDQIDDIKEYSKNDYNKLLNFPCYTLDKYIKTLHFKIFLEKYLIISNNSESIKSPLNYDYSQDFNKHNKTFSQDMESNTLKGILKFEVIDSGYGMTTDQINKLFKEYSQVGTIYQRQIGTGLGLVISKKLCILMGGNLEVNSIPQHGTNFIATIQVYQYP